MSNKGFEIPNEMRETAEKGLQQAKTALGNLLGTARKVAESVQTSTETAQTKTGAAVTKGFDYTEQHLAATFELAEKLVRSKNLKEAMDLQGEYMRNQIAALQTQAKEFTNLTEDAAKPSSEKA
ncbi:phasin [Methylobacterium sp. 4-46]|uniref:phasin family protein n=1 Tax=unclassified Methylobacterium TaxID=2615210 RepID=UPI000165CB18|nr:MULTISPECIES: phasin family protein [Methylobacterium]ACA19562.1 phasin [Methylobacterium sp. 4-46]WFT78757.1 phasin family protein [Methylobacterium nodulans]